MGGRGWVCAGRCAAGARSLYIGRCQAGRASYWTCGPQARGAGPGGHLHTAARGARTVKSAVHAPAGASRGPSTAGAQPRPGPRWPTAAPRALALAGPDERRPSSGGPAEPRALPSTRSFSSPRGPEQPESAFAQPSTWREGRVATGWGDRCSPRSQGEPSGTADAALAPARLLSPTAALCRPRGLAVPEAVGFFCLWVAWLSRVLMFSFQPFPSLCPNHTRKHAIFCCSSGHPVRPLGTMLEDTLKLDEEPCFPDQPVCLDRRIYQHLMQ
ncbi:uncharacterized protein LOC116073644 [Mastomys coucha]|uniref:uncharacterized protein LOC116073644 n=1 Tax=Mastomys coucha TaxID=35658 RepID=UPI001262674D|nr:uncharacterized protein LOC116073644 [Mastomys coucha]